MTHVFLKHCTSLSFSRGPKLMAHWDFTIGTHLGFFCAWKGYSATSNLLIFFLQADPMVSWYKYFVSLLQACSVEKVCSIWGSLWHRKQYNFTFSIQGWETCIYNAYCICTLLILGNWSNEMKTFLVDNYMVTIGLDTFKFNSPKPITIYLDFISARFNFLIKLM